MRELLVCMHLRTPQVHVSLASCRHEERDADSLNMTIVENSPVQAS